MAWKTLFAAIIALAILSPAARAQENFPEAQVSMWRIDVILEMQAHGIFVMNRNSTRHPYGATRYSRPDMAEILVASIDRLKADCNRVSTLNPRTRAERIEQNEWVRRSLALAAKHKDIGRLMRDLAPELQQSGFDLDEELRWLALAPARAKTLPLGLVQPFPDVPKNHWAAKAVENLRALGLLTGYPGGKFKG